MNSKVYSAKEREEILDSVLSLITTYRLRLIGHGVEEDAYKQYALKPKRNEFGTNRYVAALAGAVQAACEIANPQFALGEPAANICDFYIENSEYKLTAAEAVHLGENDLAFEHLQQCCRDRGFEMLILKNDPDIDPLRTDPRLRDLERKVGLPE